MAEALPGPHTKEPLSAWDVTLSVLDSRSGESQGSAKVVAPIQVSWESESDLLVLSNPVGDRYQVDRCSIDLTCEVATFCWHHHHTVIHGYGYTIVPHTPPGRIRLNPPERPPP